MAPRPAQVRQAFSREEALFVSTEGHELYPNPASHAAHGASHLARFRLLGAVLGKTLFEGLLAELPFAAFFLAKLRGRRAPD